MEEEEEVISNKAIKVKGIDTAQEIKVPEVETIEVEKNVSVKDPVINDSPKETTEPIVDPEVDSIVDPIIEEEPAEVFKKSTDNQSPGFLDYREIEDPSEAFLQDAGSREGTSSIKGYKGFIDKKALDRVYAPLNLTNALPDSNEREKFKLNNEDKLVELFNGNIGITFENDLEDLNKFKEEQYHHLTKKFMDDLDENQKWYSSLATTGARFLGNTAINVIGTSAGLIYSAGSAIRNLDASKLADNSFNRALEDASEFVNINTAVYGGAGQFDSVLNTETGQLEFKTKGALSRFLDDPMKSFNADIVPAASFIAGVVTTETLASALTAATGGAAAPLQIALSARLALQASKLGRVVSKFSKATRLMRGLDKIPKIGQQASNLSKLSRGHRSVMGTAVAAYRSSHYESSLIGMSTKDRTLDKLLQDHHIRQGGSFSPEGYYLDKEGRVIENLIAPSKSELAKYEKTATSAGKVAYFANVPLVAGSYFVQMPRLLTRNYRVAQLGAQGIKRSASKIFLDNLKLSGTRIVNGKRVANVTANKYLKGLGYVKRGTKGFITEGFEEFSQGAMEEGLIDYYANNYSKESSRSLIGMANSVVTQGRQYAKTTEGKDSMLIGGLMGLLGVRLPFGVDTNTGKVKFTPLGTVYGGALSEIREGKAEAQKAIENAEKLNRESASFNPMLQLNLKNALKLQNTTAEMDDAAIQGKIKEFKDAEHAQLFSAVYNRVELGLGDTVLQDIDAMEEMSVKDFNSQYAIKDKEGAVVEEFTEKSKKEALEKAKEFATGVLESAEIVENVIANTNPKFFERLYEEVTGREITTKQNVNNILLEQGLKEQMVYLNSVVENTNKREKSIINQIEDITSRNGNTKAFLNLNKLEEVAVKVAEVQGKESKERFRIKAEFVDNASKVKKEILDDFKKNDPNNYSLTKNEIEPLIQDILDIKVRRAKAAKLYEGLFSSKGAKTFTNFQEEVMASFEKYTIEQLEKINEEAIKDSKNPSNFRKEKNNEKSLKGKSPIADEAQYESIVEGLKKIERVKNSNADATTKTKAILRVLDKHPGMFSELIDRLDKKGLPVGELSTTQEFELIDKEGTFIDPLLKEIEILQEEIERFEALQSKEGYVADNKEDLEQVQSINGTPIEEVKENVDDALFNFRALANDYYTMLPTADKELIKTTSDREGGNTFINERDEQGNLINKPKDPFSPLNTAVVNNSNFLNNKQLENENHYFEFEIQKDNDFIESPTSNDIPIAVVYKDSKGNETFITRLPAYKDGGALQLKELREEIVRRDVEGESTSTNIKNEADRIQEIKKEKEVIKKKLQENLDAKKEAPVAEEASSQSFGEPIPIKDRATTTPLTGIDAKAGERLVEKLVLDGIKKGQTLDELRDKVLTRFGWDANQQYAVVEFIKGKMDGSITVDFATWRIPSRTQQTSEVTEEEFKEFTDNATVSDARINAIANKIKAGTELTTQEQAMREAKAAQVEESLQKDTTTELDAEQTELKAELKALNEELKNLAGSIQVDFKEKSITESIFQDITEYNSLENERIKKEKENKIKNKFSEKSLERANAINDNFENIVTAIQTSGINIFIKPETNKHKNC